MMTCAKCKGTTTVTAMISQYDAVGLGAPFKVFLDAVKIEKCANCGEVQGTYIPDMEGLFHAVVFARALEPRKLTGPEVRFVRKAMGWQSKDLAKHLGITPEYMSRCESGTKVMAPTTEKLFRIYALLKTPDQSALSELDLSNLFDLIEIDPMWDSSKPLISHFTRKPIPPRVVNGDKWRSDKRAAWGMDWEKQAAR
jgi:transcriptional regulator with XRE-family HTH domain